MHFETIPLNSIFMVTFYDECSVDCMASSDNELERMQKETAMAQFEVLSTYDWRDGGKPQEHQSS
jgi:hypothetical protein